MDNEVYEYLVAKKPGAKEYGMKAAIIFLVAFISLMTFGFLKVYGLVFTFFAIFFGYCGWVYTNVEFEYRILGDELTIDVIYGKSKRRGIGVFDLKRAELITTIDSNSAKGFERRTDLQLFNCLSGDEQSTNTKMLLVVGYGASSAKVYIEVNDRIKDYFFYKYRTKCDFIVQ